MVLLRRGVRLGQADGRGAKIRARVQPPEEPHTAEQGLGPGEMSVHGMVCICAKKFECGFDLMRGFQVDVRQGIYKGRSYVQVVDEEAMADKAFKILRCDQASCGFPLYLPLKTNLLLPHLPL